MDYKPSHRTCCFEESSEKFKISDDENSYRKCKREKETSHQIFCEFKGVASKKLRHLEVTFMDPGVYHDVRCAL
jgi:hypothetical protein